MYVPLVGTGALGDQKREPGPATEVINRCEPSNVGPRTQLSIHCKSSKCLATETVLEVSNHLTKKKILTKIPFNSLAMLNVSNSRITVRIKMRKQYLRLKQLLLTLE